MMDGLALGETTPGPLIMVVAYVGFLGAALAAWVVTWFTFLPSFLFTLAGGPLVESTHGKRHFTAPLTAITAAVVGVLVSLALFFIVHIAGGTRASRLFGLSIDGVALALVALAALALLRFKWRVIAVIATSALAGLGLRLLGGG